MIEKAEMEFYFYMYQRSGSFSTALFDAIMKADSGNTFKLAQGFPDEVEVVSKYKSESGYWEDLQYRVKNR